MVVSIGDSEKSFVFLPKNEHQNMVILPNMKYRVYLKLTKNPNMYYDTDTKQSSGLFRKKVIKFSDRFDTPHTGIITRRK